LQVTNETVTFNATSRGTKMPIKAIGVLRNTADECERQARRAKEAAAKSELFDVASRWHYLAGEAERLYQRETQLEAAAGLERC